MTKIAVRIAMASLLILSLLSGCTNSEIVSYERITVEHEIVYAYITTESHTNVYGGILGYDRYIYYGEIENGEILDCKQYVNVVTIHKSAKPYSYKEYCIERRVYSDGHHFDEVVENDLYLTDTVLTTINTDSTSN